MKTIKAIWKAFGRFIVEPLPEEVEESMRGAAGK